MTLLRSLLFVPGNQPKMLEKALGFAPDAVVPDMEDSVPPQEKINARKVIAEHLPRLSEGGRVVIPRINALDTGLVQDDLRAVISQHIFGVSIGKIQGVDDLVHVSQIIEKLEQEASLTPGVIKLIPWLETAPSIINAYEICKSSDRIVAVAFGAEDFAQDMGIERSEDEAESLYVRQKICVAARAADLLALDTPYFKFKDDDGLRSNSLAARALGFKGKFAIHPGQIEVINRAFSPSEEEIEHAQRVVDAYEQAERMGRGSTSLDGMVIDVPVVKRARATLEFVKADSSDQ
ncbi:MAG: CoA ester lyase [Gammaproteobacteria bacterium]|nr:CoA ester lyase [Gammaproteobacteria bacterium]